MHGNNDSSDLPAGRMEGSSKASYTVIFIVGYSSGTMEIMAIKDLAAKEELPHSKKEQDKFYDTISKVKFWKKM